MRKLYLILPVELFNKRYKDSDSLFCLYQFNGITATNFNFQFCTNAKGATFRDRTFLSQCEVSRRCLLKLV